MLTQLLLLSCVCAVAVTDDAAPAPPYVQYLTAIYTEANIVMVEVLPLMDSIPFLDSPQRHFAAILHFIDVAARTRSGCVVLNYDEEYMKVVNSSALDGLANPQGAVDELVNLMTILQTTIIPVVNMIEDTDPDMEENKRNKIIDERIKEDLESYEIPAAVFLATGKAATIAVKLNKEISKAAYDLTALKFLAMIVHLLMAAMTAVGVMSQVPPYTMYSSELRQTYRNLAVNIISMEDHIPLLNDPRRQYVEIIHVILTHGIFRSGCVVDNNYYLEYYQYLSDSLPEAICDTGDVIARIRRLLNEIQENTNKLLELTKDCAWENCDEIIEKIIKDQPGVYNYQDQVLIAAGKLAILLNEHHQQFEQVSRELRASQYLMQSPAELEGVVNAVAVLHRILHPTYC
uniref:Uncharacterized protein n=1 Tax=Heliothis virescens TaxID=7102 RepID=A0A2A4JX74_HELVI